MKDLGHGPQSRDEFEARLRAIGAERYHDRHPFHARLHGGDCTPDEVRAWVINRWMYQSRIPMKDAAFMSRVTDPDLRRAWRKRIEDHDGGLVETIELTGFDGESNETGEVVVKAPVRPGTHVWRAVCPAQSQGSVSPADASTSFSFTVKPHATRVVVWDAPPTVERGKRFGIKLGVQCPSECRPKGWVVDVRDHEGKRQATATLRDAPWPGTATLYYAEVDLTAPDAEGLFSWEARAPGSGVEVPHAEGTARFGVRVVLPPECRLTVVAVDAERQTPVRDAKVVVHPYRAVTDERGVAEVGVPKGAYRLFVSGPTYVPFRWDGEITTDLTIRAELALDLGISDADIWS